MEFNLNKLNAGFRKKCLETNDEKILYPAYIQNYIGEDSNFDSVLIQKKGTIIRHKIKSEFLNNERNIDIYLPPSYKKNKTKNYPVLYMHDGNNLFYPEIAFGGVPWQADITADKLISKSLIQEIIIVGVHNTIGRNFEYTWTEMNFPGGKKEGGGGEKYARFLIEELKPFIDKNYRTSKSRNDTGVMGSSLGGLISFYLGIKHPDVFGKIGVISPSFWWGYGEALRDVKNIQPYLKIWMDMGIREGGNFSRRKNTHINNLQKMKAELINKGYIEGYNLGYYEDKNGFHNEYSWSKRLHMPFLFFFGKRN